ncbi:histone-like nucleoid-structuring protein Lsr2 [Rhodococcoides yunnanense]|uniref:histone-like nucleoid-structuring protein Lsr2 n=1 Tax=Rhodococcoides yunnanense TaxID=278209 RepID=UPI0009346E2D|nr:Lsr2 family protein [Rhodococcus yunnanensis]
MARKTLVQMIDDVDGSVIKDGQGETIEFGIGGNQYRIDLNLKHANELHEQLAFWIEHAEKVSGRRVKKAGAAPARGKVDLQDIRAWARDNGYDVSARGRISQDVQSAYEAAH